MGRKHCGKRRNCSLQAISPFPTVFSKGSFQGVSKGVIVREWVKKVIYISHINLYTFHNNHLINSEKAVKKS